MASKRNRTVDGIDRDHGIDRIVVRDANVPRHDRIESDHVNGTEIGNVNVTGKCCCCC